MDEGLVRRYFDFSAFCGFTPSSGPPPTYRHFNAHTYSDHNGDVYAQLYEISNFVPVWRDTGSSGASSPGYVIDAIRFRGVIEPGLFRSLVPLSPQNSIFLSPVVHRIMLVLDNYAYLPFEGVPSPNDWFAKVYDGSSDDIAYWQALSWFINPLYTPRLRILADETYVSQPALFVGEEIGTEPDYSYPTEYQPASVFFSMHVRFPKGLPIRWTWDTTTNQPVADKAIYAICYSYSPDRDMGYSPSVRFYGGLRVYFH